MSKAIWSHWSQLVTHLVTLVMPGHICFHLVSLVMPGHIWFHLVSLVMPGHIGSVSLGIVSHLKFEFPVQNSGKLGILLLITKDPLPKDPLLSYMQTKTSCISAEQVQGL